MKKHSLVKVVMVTLFLVMVATWGLSVTNISDGEFVTQTANKIGIFHVSSFILVAVQYFFNIALFVLAIGGFYGVLHKIPQYRLLLDKIVNGFKRCEWLFMVIVGIVFAVLSSMAGFSLPLLILFPFVISVILLMGYDKVTAAMLTIGSTVAGIIGTVFSSGDVYGISTVLSQFGSVGPKDNVLWKLLLLGVSLVIVLVNTILHARKHKNEETIEEDYLIPKEVKTENKKVFPLVIIFDLMLVLFVLAFISWDVLEIDIFENITNTFVNPVGNVFTKGMFGAFNTVLGISESMVFGNWSLTEVAVVLFFVSGLLALMYRKSLNSFLSDFGSGAKKALQPAALVILAYTILVCVTNVPFMMTILKPILDLEGEANIVVMCIVALVYSLLTVEPYYGITSAASYVLTVTTASKLTMVSLAWQSMYGIAMLFAPTSVIMLCGLSYLGIGYGKWLKNIWYVVVELIVVIALLLLLV